MKIVQATHYDLIEVLFLLQESVYEMNKKGLKHWNNAFPGSKTIQLAVENQTLYIYKELGICKGMVILSDEEPDGYNDIDWKLNSDKVLYLKFLAINPLFLNRDIEMELIKFAEQKAKKDGYSALRLDVHSGIENYENMLNHFGFNKTGQFFSSFQKTPYFAYEKSL